MINYYRYNSHDFKITKREVIASISIIAILMLIGFLISGKITEYQMDKNEKYNKALKITNTEIFQYGMNTNIGNAFVYGDLKAVDTVSYSDIKGEYSYIKKVKEKYTRHTRQVAHTRKVGKTTTTYYTTETYWTWDYVSEESKKCKELEFCGVKFKSDKIDLPSSEYKDTVDGGYHIRYVYSVCKNQYKGTIFAYLSDKTIKDKASFYNEMTIEKAVKYLESGFAEIIFWFVWIIFIGLCVFGFYYLDNRWLEN